MVKYKILGKMNNFIDILKYRKDKYTSTGNDGIIEYILKKINIRNGIFVEFGAWDGIKNSNCRKLFEEGWGGILIESDSVKYDNLKKNYEGYENIMCVNEKIRDIGKKSFDSIMKEHLEDGHIDFCSIDIDGLDLEIFETFEKYLPTVICIEGGQMLHPFNKRVKKKVAKKNIQQSLKVINDSFEDKGYKILCSYQDSFFVKKEFYHLFNVTSDLLTLYFNGLRALPRRMPFIQKYTNRVNLNNSIIDNIIENSEYKKYKWIQRKKWAIDKIKLINKSIDKIEKRERNKYEKN